MLTAQLSAQAGWVFDVGWTENVGEAQITQAFYHFQMYHNCGILGYITFPDKHGNNWDMSHFQIHQKNVAILGYI